MFSKDFLIRATNRIALFSVICMLYWVFSFICITVFDLNVFQELITVTFYWSILGLFVILSGTFVLSIMFNLSKISESISQKVTTQSSSDRFTLSSKVKLGGILIVFPLLALLLFGGDYLTEKRKEDMLACSAQQIITEFQSNINSLINYEYSENYIRQATKYLKLLKKIDQEFVDVALIAIDKIENKDVFIVFRHHSCDDDDKGCLNNKYTLEENKINYVYRTNIAERDYLEQVFFHGKQEHWLEKTGNRYQLYFPVFKDNKVIVLVFSDYQHYGGFGS